MRTWLCALVLFSFALFLAQEKSIEQAPIRRVVIYKNGHCLTEREIVVDHTENPFRLVNATNALLGGVWAVSRHKTISLSGIYARLMEEKRLVAPGSLAELLMLNEGKRVALTLMFPAPTGQETVVQVENREGVLRVFKPSVRFEDAYPTADAPPEYTPTPTPQPPRRDWYYPSWYNPLQPPPSQNPPDYVQDSFSRTASQASFAVETPQGMYFFTPAQVKRIEFLDPPVREREVTVRRPVLELTLSGGRRGERVPVALYSLEKGIRWFPEYHLNLSSARASEGELVLGATIINELDDLKEVDAAVAVGAIQFMMQDHPSPLSLRDEFRRLSRWFGEEPNDPWRYSYATFRMSDLVSAGGFGGFGGGAVPSAPNMGFELQRTSMVSTDTVAFLPVPKLTLPKNSSIRVELSRHKLPVEHAFLWVRDLSMRERDYYSYYRPRRPQRLQTLDDLAYKLAYERRFRGEVYEAIILKNTQDTPWTTAPILVMRNGMPIAQDIMLFTPPGEEAFIFVTPATQIDLSCTVEEYTESSGFGRSFGRTHRGVIRIQNAYERPVRLMVRLRFIGHFEEASRAPTRISTKSADDPRLWDWYYRSQLQMNPYTELIWDVEVPPGASEWWFRFERRGN